MTTGCYEARFWLFVNARGTGILLDAKYPAPGALLVSNAQGVPGGTLAARIQGLVTGRRRKRDSAFFFLISVSVVIHIQNMFLVQIVASSINRFYRISLCL